MMTEFLFIIVDPGTENRALWRTQDILELINLYKEAISLFKSTTMKNRKVWQYIAVKLPPYTSEQCENKFKYLKRKYIEKIDNMGTSQSGKARMNFEFFDQFDAIVKHSHNVQPTNIASASRIVQNVDSILQHTSNPVESTSSNDVDDRPKTVTPTQVTEVNGKGKRVRDKINGMKR